MMLEMQLPQDEQQKLNTDTTTITEEGKHRLVILFDTDADGLAAAWCINKGFKDEYSSVLLVPQRAGDNTIPEGLLPTDSIYMVDRTYPWDVLVLLSQQVFSVAVIDHHKSAMDDYLLTEGLDVATDSDYYVRTASSLFFDYGNITVSIDTTHSACMLAHLWVMEHGVDPDTSVGVPWFIQYIEDRDIWTWKLPASKEINAGMYYYGHTFNNYSDWYSYCTPVFEYNRNLQIESMKVVGEVVLNTQLNIIKSIAHGPTIDYRYCGIPHPVTVNDGAGPVEVDALRVAIVCVPFTLISDFGNYMLNCTDEGFITPDVVLCYNKVDDGYIYSIRSKYDMIWLAKMFNGGGHPNACGFKSILSPTELLKTVH